MAEIELIDFKGGYVVLTFSGAYKTSRKGLVETWCYADKDWSEKFSILPIPLFTEWWEM